MMPARHRRQPAIPSDLAAERAAMNSTELLEQILLALPMRFLLTTASQVCKRWRDTIASSPAVQQKLFFRPIAEPGQMTSATPNFDDAGCYHFNPLLRELFAPLFESRTFPGDTREHVLGPIWGRLGLYRRPDAFRRSGASWRRMLTQQPPAPGMAFLTVAMHSSRATPIGHQRGWYRAEEQEGTGLRMGVLYDCLWDLLRVGTVKPGTPQGCIVWAEQRPSSKGEGETTGAGKPPGVNFLIADTEVGERRVWDVIGGMLCQSDVVIIRFQDAMFMDPPSVRPGWSKFKCEDFAEVPVVRASYEPVEDNPEWTEDDLHRARRRVRGHGLG